jgi:hypothetical protein
MKAKKKFPDLNKDGKITKADILKGRGVFKKGGKVKAKSQASNPAYASSKSRQAAEKMLDDKLREEGYTQGRSDSRAPSFKLTQDTKSGEYRFRKLEKGGKMPKYKKGGGMSGLSAAQKEVYRRGLAAYMSSGNRPKVSQHAWAMARVKSDFGKREAAKIRAGKGKKKK